ncbi:MAG: glycosyltransferase family 2 protein [Geminicoccaceae bacterium]|nr:glycosyltransferase family 2 protein [Geminicoccaceae bacterium]MCX7628616.1 glycosyltransferase family 2 protein [Geminicoccaceae bacterium]MDW8124829.1 glycosyltransferase family 2 protein [Geminicoccaceae bacterium]MDW8340647.1 glycosyltransferase family 2 protein [Geminicoccaceae bacterium]
MPDSPTLSIVVPMRNEAKNLARLHERLAAVLERLGESAEIVCVDDGSTDGTLDMLRLLRAIDPRVKVLSLSRNFGKEAALAAGLRYARGRAVILMDADLQHPPETIERFVALWRQGWEVVFGQRTDRRTDGAVRRWLSAAFYRLFALLSQTDLPTGAGDFRLLDRKVVDALNRLEERTRFTKGLYSWVGFKQIGVPYEVAERAEGRSRFGLLALWRLAVDGITAFSTVPLRVWSYLGLVVSSLAIGFGGWILLRTLVWGADLPGYPSIIVAIMLLSGVQLVGLGVLGEYVGRIFAEVKHRPLFLVREEIGFDDRASRPRSEALEPVPAEGAPPRPGSRG